MNLQSIYNKHHHLAIFHNKDNCFHEINTSQKRSKVVFIKPRELCNPLLVEDTCNGCHILRRFILAQSTTFNVILNLWTPSCQASHSQHTRLPRSFLRPSLKSSYPLMLYHIWFFDFSCSSCNLFIALIFLYCCILFVVVLSIFVVISVLSCISLWFSV